VAGSDSISQAGIYGTQGVSSTTNIPGARDSQISWIGASGNLWLFAGLGMDKNGSFGALNDLWRISPPNWYADNDGDWFGDQANLVVQFIQPEGYVSDSTDCDDNDADVYPGAPGLLDGKDNDCDGTIDLAVTSLRYTVSENEPSIFPNPIENELIIDLRGLPTSVPYKIYIYKMDGVIVRSLQVPESQQLVQIDMSRFEPGVFMITLETPENLSTYKIFKN